MKELKEYTKEELQSLYNRFEVWAITEHFIYLRNYSPKTRYMKKISYLNCGVATEKILKDKSLFDKPEVMEHVVWLSNSYWNSKYKMDDIQDPNEKLQEQIKSIALDWCYNIFEYFLNPYWHLEEENIKYLKNEDYENRYVLLHSRHPDYPRFCSFVEYEEWYHDYYNGNIPTFLEELHGADGYYIDNGMATDTEIFYFVWHTLQHLSVSEMKKLKELARDDWKVRFKGRPANDLPIYKYDLKWNLVETYKNRAECIKKNGIPKSKLSDVIKGKQKQYKGFIYTENIKVGS